MKVKETVKYQSIDTTYARYAVPTLCKGLHHMAI